MSSYGVTSTGFKRKRLDAILADLNAEMKSIFGENLNVSPESPDGQINGVKAESDANLWEIAEAAYNAFNPNAASGSALSNLVLLNFITRGEAKASTVTLTLTGLNGVVIPAGSQVSTSDNIASFTTDSEVTIPVSGTITVPATATETGPIEAVAGSITLIDTPVTGWSTVTNLADADIGENEETDVELRARRANSIARLATSVAASILAEVLEVVNVDEAFIYENDQAVTDPVTGTPPNQFQVVVKDGDDTEIAQAIYKHKPIGIQSFGTTTVSVTDTQGNRHDIRFTRPTVIPIYVVVNIKVFSIYPANGSDTIKQNIVDYANSVLIPGRGFGVGDDIILSELFTPINTVPGHTIESVFIGVAPSPTLEEDLVIDFDQVSEFDVVNITVNETPA